MSTLSLGTISGSITLPDKGVSTSIRVTLSANLNIGTPGGYVDGDQLQLAVFQGGSGTAVVTLIGANYDGGAQPVLPLVAGKSMLVTYVMLDGQFWETARTFP